MYSTQFSWPYNDDCRKRPTVYKFNKDKAIHGKWNRTILDVLTERKLRRIRCIVAEKRGGAVWRVRLYCNVKRSGKVIADLHLDSDQRQNLITSRGSPCTPCPCLPCLVDVRKRVRQLFCLQTEWQTDKHTDRQTNRQTDDTDRITPPWRSNTEINVGL